MRRKFWKRLGRDALREYANDSLHIVVAGLRTVKRNVIRVYGNFDGSDCKLARTA